MKRLTGSWNKNLKEISGYSYTCGYCGSIVGPSTGYICKGNDRLSGQILICPNCNKPTFLNKLTKEQVPGPLLDNIVFYLPENIEQLYNEARKCISINSFTSAVLSCRKLLMNVSVAKGAKKGQGFIFYVDYLHENHYIPPDSRGWVDLIRTKGNEATHEIPNISEDDAVELIEFTEMLLRFVYELPSKMEKHTKKVKP